MSARDDSKAIARRQTSHSTFFGDTWVIFKRWTTKTAQDRFVVITMILFPVLWLGLFTQIFQSVVQIPGFAANSYLDFFVPAMVVLMVQITTGDTGISLVEDIENGMFEKVLAAPVSRTAIFLGKALADELMIVVQAGVALALGLLLGADIETGVIGVIGLLGVSVLYSLWFVALSTIIALRTRSSKATSFATQLISWPLMFLSTVFMPLEFLPEWLQELARLNPMTYGIDVARTIMLDGWIWEEIVPALGVLAALGVVFGVAAIISLGRATNASAQ